MGTERDQNSRREPYYTYYEEGTIEEEAPKNLKNVILAVCLIAVIALSIFFSGVMSSPETYDGTISKLDDTKATVAKMAAGATAASAAITVIPGDVGTPIAEQLADMSGYFIFIYTAIYVEKYLTTTGGLIVFRFMVPIALLLVLFAMFWRRESSERIKRIGLRLLAFSLILWVVVPFSVMISNNIEKTYETSINETLAQAEENTNAIKEEAEKDKEDQNWISGLIDSAKDSATGVTEEFQETLNQLLDAIAVMIVTTCVIPIGVLLFLLWVVKMLFGINLRLPSPKRKGRKFVNQFNEWRGDGRE